MLCEYLECRIDANTICKTCEAGKFFCHSHSCIHLDSEQKHSLELIKPSEIKNFVQTWTNSQIRKHSLKITDQTKEMIDVIKKSSKEKIEKLKKSNSKIEKIIQFEPAQFDDQKVKLIIELAEFLGIDQKFVSYEEMRLLREVESKNYDLKTLSQNILNLNNDIKNLKNEKNKILAEKNEEIKKNMIMESERKNEIDKINSVLEKAEEDFNDLKSKKSKEIESLKQEIEYLKTESKENENLRIKLQEQNNIKTKEIKEITYKLNNSIDNQYDLEKKIKLLSIEKNQEKESFLEKLKQKDEEINEKDKNIKQLNEVLYSKDLKIFDLNAEIFDLRKKLKVYESESINQRKNFVAKISCSEKKDDKTKILASNKDRDEGIKNPDYNFQLKQVSDLKKVKLNFSEFEIHKNFSKINLTDRDTLSNKKSINLNAETQKNLNSLKISKLDDNEKQVFFPRNFGNNEVVNWDLKLKKNFNNDIKNNRRISKTPMESKESKIQGKQFIFNDDMKIPKTGNKLGK